MTKPALAVSINSGHALATGLVACWPMLEGSGTASADKTGNGHDLTLDAVATSWTTIDGDVAIEKTDLASRGSTMASNLTLNPSTKSFSIAWQARQAADNANGVVLGFASAVTPNVYMNGSANAARVNTAAGNAIFTKTLFTTMEHHLLTWDRPTGQMRYYVNGVEESTSPLTPTISASMEFDSAIGGRLTSGNLVGTILYLYVWEERVLSAAEAAALVSDPYVFLTSRTATFSTDYRQNGTDLVKHTFDWVSDASGAATMASSNAISGQIERVVIIPYADTAPTANYDLTLTDEHEIDVLAGQGANMSASASLAITPGTPLKDGTTVRTVPTVVDGILTLNVTNAGDTKSGTVEVYVR